MEGEEATYRCASEAASVWAIAAFVVLLFLASAPDVRAQAAERIQALTAAHEQAQRNHLWRVAAWGGANLALGAGLMGLSSRPDHPARFGYGLQSGIWGAVNVGIAGVGLASGAGAPTGGLGAALASVRGYHDILLLNIGLNVAYASIGTAMVIASYRDVASARSWRGHGAALIMQGAGLLVLDGVAFWGARRRLDALIDIAGEATLSVTPMGARLLVYF